MRRAASFLLLTALIALTNSAHLRPSVQDDQEDERHFVDFLNYYRKSYNSTELATRLHIFRDQLHRIRQHNADSRATFRMEINRFSDLTEEEFQLYKSGPTIRQPLGLYTCTPFEVTSAECYTAGNEFDWREHNAVTAVKDQGQCGSCWAFSSVGAMEGEWAKSTGELVDLSEQQLVECATGIKYGSHGCSGGQMDGAFKYAITSGGLCVESAYPYTAKDGETCSAASCDKVVKFSECMDVESSNQMAMKYAVWQRPVSVAIQASSRYFQSYASGILTSTDCGTDLDHGVLVVGYGEENGQKYWIVKNSWSDDWGENGYVRIARSESENDEGICGIAMQPSFIVADV